MDKKNQKPSKNFNNKKFNKKVKNQFDVQNFLPLKIPLDKKTPLSNGSFEIYGNDDFQTYDESNKNYNILNSKIVIHLLITFKNKKKKIFLTNFD